MTSGKKNPAFLNTGSKSYFLKNNFLNIRIVTTGLFIVVKINLFAPNPEGGKLIFTTPFSRRSVGLLWRITM